MDKEQRMEKLDNGSDTARWAADRIRALENNKSNRKRIKEIALSVGFKLNDTSKPEPDLKEYVYAFAEKLINMTNENRAPILRYGMSGGHFNYIQNQIDDASIEITEKAKHYEKTCDQLTIARFQEAAITLEKAAKMLQRNDWFISYDDGEESFNERWVEDGL